jgi:hypothetical protein
VGIDRLAELAAAEAAGLAVSEPGGPAPAADDPTASAHRAFAKAAFNGAWDLIDLPQRSPEQERHMLALAFASRWHWGEVGTAENRAVSDWQIAHVASVVGEPRLAHTFASAAYDLTRSAGLPMWMQASTSEGMARAAAANGDRAGFDRYVAEARALLAQVDDPEDVELIESQLASIPPP